MIAEKRKLHIVFHGFNDEEKMNILHILNGKLNNADKTLILVRMNLIDEKERLAVRGFVNRNLDSLLILFSENIEAAQFAWDVGADGFINISREKWGAQLIHVLNASRKLWTIGSQQQIDFVDVAKITFVLAQGNYSYVNFCDRSRVLITKQLGKIESELAVFPDFERVGKSVLVNLARIRCIKDNCVYFDSKDVVRFSKSSKWIKILKDRLLWK